MFKVKEINQTSILPYRIRNLIEMSNDMIPHLFEDEADEYEAYCLKMMLYHNEKLRRLKK